VNFSGTVQRVCLVGREVEVIAFGYGVGQGVFDSDYTLFLPALDETFRVGWDGIIK